MLKKLIIALSAFLVILLLSSPAFCLTNILNIRHWSASDHTRIVIDTSDEADIRITKSPQRVTIDFNNAQYPDDLALEFALNKPGIEKIQVTPLADEAVTVELTLTGCAEAAVFKLKEVQDRPFRVVIDLKFPEIEKKESEARRQYKTAQKDKIIVIDPGHGGEDPGAVGPKKTMEKDVVLKIAQKLEWLLNHRKGYRAFLTRNTDYYPSFKKRLQIAKEYGADLFISIHADAARSRRPFGSSVYCLSTKGASSVAARLLARQENLADIVGGSENEQNADETDPITLHMIQTETINMSKAFGTTILDHLKKFSAVKFPHIQEAPFIVLKLPHIPSILVETGYISNPREEMLLRDNQYQNKIALALCASIQQFLRDPEPEVDAVQIVQEESKEAVKDQEKSAPLQQETVSRPLPRMILYRVKKGENLNAVAKKFNTSPAALAKLNHLQKDEVVRNRLLKVYLPAGGENELRKGTPPEPSRPAGKPVYHIVKRGESLGGIAQKYNVSLADLSVENKIKTGAPLYIGKRLAIPGTKDQGEKKQEPGPGSADPAKPKFHIVKRGESLAGIAQRYNVSLADLTAENKIKPGTPLYIDKRLKIPGSSVEEKKQNESAPADPVPDKPKFHIVKRGDSLAEIAKKYDVSLKDLSVENKIKPGAHLPVNKRLKIPGPFVEEKKKNESAPAAPVSSKPKFHVVKRGESIEKIAKHYGVTTASLLKENKMKPKDNLWVERKLRIP